MLGTNSLFWLPFILIVNQNLGLSRGTLVEKWIAQYQDHFDLFNDETWSMRYYESDEFYHQSGPIFIVIGGEYALTPDIIEADYMLYDMAKIYGAMIYGIEHRYYGRSHPVRDTSLKNLKYLSVSQTLADIALFIKTKKKELNDFNAFTMVFGCSYAGNLAAWLRVAYPNWVQGALAGSAPIYVKADFLEYYEFVGNSIRKYDENCAINIKEAFSTLEELLDNPAINSIKVKNDFKLCSTDFSQPSEISYMMLNLARIFGSAILDNRIEVNGKTSIENRCIAMRENETISSYHRLAGVFKGENLKNHSCINFKYRYAIVLSLLTSWKSQNVENRLWTYQMCTELGYFVTLLSPVSIFGRQVPLQYFMDRCKDILGVGFNRDDLDRNIKKINRLYNSKLPQATNIIFINGDLDPWRSLSVLSDLNGASPAILINGASHCGFLGQALEKKNIMAARCDVSFMIHEWLQKWLK